MRNPLSTAARWMGLGEQKTLEQLQDEVDERRVQQEKRVNEQQVAEGARLERLAGERRDRIDRLMEIEAPSLPEAVFRGAANTDAAGFMLETGIEIGGTPVVIPDTPENRQGLAHLAATVEPGTRLVTKIVGGVLFIGPLALALGEVAGSGYIALIDPTGIAQVVLAIMLAARTGKFVWQFAKRKRGEKERREAAYGRLQEEKDMDARAFLAFLEGEDKIAESRDEEELPGTIDEWTKRWLAEHAPKIEKLIAELDHEPEEKPREEAHRTLEFMYRELGKQVYPIPKCCTDLLKPIEEGTKHSAEQRSRLRRLHKKFTQKDESETRVTLLPPWLAGTPLQIVREMNTLLRSEKITIDPRARTLLEKAPAMIIGSGRSRNNAPENALFSVLLDAVQSSNCSVEIRGSTFHIVPGSSENLWTDGQYYLAQRNPITGGVTIAADPSIGKIYSVKPGPKIAAKHNSKVDPRKKRITVTGQSADANIRYAWGEFQQLPPISSAVIEIDESGGSIVLELGGRIVVEGKIDGVFDGPDGPQEALSSTVLENGSFETRIDIFKGTDRTIWSHPSWEEYAEGVKMNGECVEVQYYDEKGELIPCEFVAAEALEANNDMKFIHKPKIHGRKPATVRVLLPGPPPSSTVTLPRSFLKPPSENVPLPKKVEIIQPKATGNE